MMSNFPAASFFKASTETVVALKKVSVEIFKGEIFGLVGPDGAGKTTLFNLLSGNLEPTKGKVIFKGRDITDLPAHRTAHLGIGRSFQITNVFPHLTVLENCILALIWVRKMPRREAEEVGMNVVAIAPNAGLAPKPEVSMIDFFFKHLDVN